MNYGPLIFLAAFLGMAGSWLGFVFAPQVQLGSLQATNKVGAVTYPLDRPGLAKAGLDVYRANGCAYCHSQQIDQTGTEFEVLLGSAGTNLANVEAALKKLQSAGLSADPARILATLPATVLRTVDRVVADNAMKSLTGAGAKAALGVNPVGLDIARGWGRRRTVAEDFLFDKTVMPGSQRIGPDLANAGVRLPDPNWHFRHLYSPRVEVKGSTMPAYPFLFEKRKVEGAPSPDALLLPAPLAPPPGYEILPTPDAKALVAYLLSLRADAALFSTPLAVAAIPVATATNAPATIAPSNTATNTAAPVSPAK